MKAFTLVELLISVSILTMLAAFAVPSFQILLSQYQLSSTANELAGFIRLTEQKTVTEQKIYGVTLNANTTSVTQYVIDGATSAKTTQAIQQLPPNIKIGSVQFSGSQDISFKTSGAPSTAGSLTIKDTIRNKSKEIVISPSGAITSSGGEF